MTDSRQRALSATPQLVSALARSYDALRADHPDLPAALLLVETHHPAATRKLAHWSAGELATEAAVYAGRLVLFNSPPRLGKPSVLTEGAVSVFETIAHEAAHALGTARGIKNTSRGGRYHNEQYKALAEELGLEVSLDGASGWTNTTPSKQMLDRYADTIADLERHLPRLPGC